MLGVRRLRRQRRTLLLYAVATGIPTCATAEAVHFTPRAVVQLAEPPRGAATTHASSARLIVPTT